MQASKDNPNRVLIVYEYLDVFSEELRKLPLKWEIEFTINVVPETTLISQTLYQMAPSELNELKNQLKLLMEKGYI